MNGIPRSRKNSPNDPCDGHHLPGQAVNKGFITVTPPSLTAQDTMTLACVSSRGRHHNKLVEEICRTDT